MTVSMDEAVFAGNGVEEFEMVPPEERIPETAAVSPELEALHEKRLLHCEALRRERGLIGIPKKPPGRSCKDGAEKNLSGYLCAAGEISRR